MPDLLKICLVLVAILAFTRMKWNIGYVLLIASGMLFGLYLMPPGSIIATVVKTLTDITTIKLFFSLTLIRVLELVLREKEVLKRMTEASRLLLKKRRAVIVSMPLLIGMLPSLGGAYFSAPMVDEATRELQMPPEEKGFINYWFRHPWEYILPLYPGLLLASAVTGMELRELILVNLLFAALVVITGFLFSMRNIGGKEGGRESGKGPGSGVQDSGKSHHSLQNTPHASPSGNYRQMTSFLPLLLILALVMVLHVELQYGLAMTLTALFLYYRYSPREIGKALEYGFTKEVIFLIFGIMLFKFSLEDSGAVRQLSEYFRQQGIPLLPVLILLPFLTGLLTGITVGFVGSSFPLVISLAGGSHLHEIALAFASGFTGVLLSPVHLCLVLTREYFSADIWGIYRKTIPASLIIMTAAIAEYFIL